MCYVTMAVHPQIGSSQFATINKTRMTQTIGKNQPTATNEGGNRADISKIPGAKRQCCVRSLELCEGQFKILVRRECSGNQSRRASSSPVLLRSLDGGPDHIRMGGKTEIVVRREQQNTSSVEINHRTGGRAQRPQASTQMSCSQCLQVLFEHADYLLSSGLIMWLLREGVPLQ